MRNIWGSDPEDVNADEFCPYCEREIPWHYESCPVRPGALSRQGGSADHGC